MATKYPPGEYTLWIDVGLAGGDSEKVINVPEHFSIAIEEWASMSDEEKESMLNEASEEYLWEQCCCGFRVGE